ncbi:MAG TPA: HAD family hydrolase [Acidimicrobiales bacterium]
MDRWASFDCYGTLIDWNGGISAVLTRLWPAADGPALLDVFHAIEPVVQRDGGLRYRTVLERSLRALAAARGLPLTDEDATALADSLPEWPPFPEVAGALTRLRTDGWSLAILSNTDPDYLDASIARLGVEIDERVVASEIGSYKPAHRHWEELARRIGPGPVTHVHVAASLFHDVEPCADLGIATVWVNRLGEHSPVPRAAEVPDLTDLPAILAGLA